MNLAPVILPALAGYWFLSQTYYFKPTLAQTPPYTFPLLCAVYGVALGLAALVCAGLVRLSLYWLPDLVPPVDLVAWIEAQVSASDLSTVAILLVLTLALPCIVNHYLPAEEVARKWVVPDESPLARLLREAAERGTTVEVVTTEGDSHVGRVVAPEYPWEWHEDVEMVVAVSGYRQRATGEVVHAVIDVGEGVRSTVVVPRASVLWVKEVV